MLERVMNAGHFINICCIMNSFVAKGIYDNFLSGSVPSMNHKETGLMSQENKIFLFTNFLSMCRTE